MAYSIESIARYILDKTGEISVMKLQKLVYYCQAWSLAWDGKALIKENFQARRFGPICVKLERMLDGKDKYVTSANDFVLKTEKELDKDAIETMDAIIDSYGKFEASDLSQMTHMEKPWIDARRGLPREARGHKVISQEAMAKFYKSL